MIASNAFQRLTKFKPKASGFTISEKWKGGRLEKIFNYWNGVRFDYVEALKGNKALLILHYLIN